MDFSYFLVVLLSMTICSSIKLSLKTKPAVIGNDIILVCEVNANRSTVYPVIWEKGNNLIAIDKSVADDPNKYAISKISTNHALIIRKLSYHDLNFIYLCSYGFEYDKHMLDLNGDIEKHPTEDSTIIDQTYDVDGNLRINVTFTEVYPSPTCKMFLNGIDLSKDLNYTSTKHGWFTVCVSYLQRTDGNQCQEQSLSLECRFGSYRRQIINETSQPPCNKDTPLSTKVNVSFHNNNDAVKTKGKPSIIDEDVLFTDHLNDSPSFKQPLLFTGILLGLLGLILIGFFVIRRQQKQREKTEYHKCSVTSERTQTETDVNFGTSTDFV